LHNSWQRSDRPRVPISVVERHVRQDDDSTRRYNPRNFCERRGAQGGALDDDSCDRMIGERNRVGAPDDQTWYQLATIWPQSLEAAAIEIDGRRAASLAPNVQCDPIYRIA